MGVLPSLLTLAIAGHQLVLVPTSSSTDICAPSARIASVIRATPELRLVRVELRRGETLADARTRLAADVAVAGRRVGDRLTVQVIDDRTSQVQEVPRNRADPVAEALRTAWPKDKPPLLEARALGVPNDEAIVAACRGDAEQAYALSGAAVGRTIPTLIAPPPKWSGRGLLVDWARAGALADAGQCGRALPLLERTLRALERGELAPVWRRPPGDPEKRPSSLAVVDDVAIAYFAGTFVAMDLLTGTVRWQHEVGIAEPRLVETERHLIAATESELIAIERKTGRIAWRFEGPQPAPEIVEHHGRIFAATSREIVSIERGSGRVAWRFDPLVAPIGGPVMVDRQLAIPAGSAVVFLDPTSGEELRRVDLGDELAAPLTATPQGSVWALVGSDEILRVDSTNGTVNLRTSALLAAAWPPAVIAEQLVVAARYRRRPVLAWVDPGRRNGVGRTVVGGLPPIVALPDYSGVLYRQRRPAAIVARDLSGNLKWTARFPGSVASLSTHGDVVVGAVGRQAIVLDRKKGSRITSMTMDDRVVELVYAQTGGVALTENGAVYGLPSGYDPRPAAWLRNARLETAACRLALGRRTAASALAKKVVERNRDDLDAQAILADATGSNANAVLAWRNVMTSAPRFDVVQTKARNALKKRVGLAGFLQPTKPIRDVVLAGDTIVTKEGDFVVARSIADPVRTVWQNKGAISAGTDSTVFVDGRLAKASDGQAAADRGAAAVSGALFARKEDRLGALSSDGSSRWEMTIDSSLRVLASNERHVLLAGSGPGAVVRGLDVSSGAPRFVSTYAAAIVDGFLVGDVAIVRTAQHFVFIDANSGRVGRRVALKKEPIRFAQATPRGVVFAAGNRMMLLDAKRARVLPMFRARATIEGVVTTADVVWVRHDDDTLSTYHLARRQVRGRVRMGPIAKLASSSKHVVALEKSGLLWVFDAERMLAR